MRSTDKADLPSCVPALWYEMQECKACQERVSPGATGYVTVGGRSQCVLKDPP